MVPLAAGRPTSVAAVEAALSGEEKLLACISVRPEKSSEQDAKPDDVFEVGTLVMIKRMERVEDTLHLIVQGTDRVRVLAWTQTEPFLKARVQILPELTTQNAESVEATTRNVKSLIQQALAYLPQVPPEVRPVVLGADDPVKLAYFLGSILNLGVEKEQQMLEANGVDDLIHLAHDFLAREVEIIRLRSKIASEAQTEMDKAQRGLRPAPADESDSERTRRRRRRGCGSRAVARAPGKSRPARRSSARKLNASWAGWRSCRRCAGLSRHPHVSGFHSRAALESFFGR
jgi:ATP-dependent Lon protease